MMGIHKRIRDKKHIINNKYKKRIFIHSYISFLLILNICFHFNTLQINMKNTVSWSIYSIQMMKTAGDPPYHFYMYIYIKMVYLYNIICFHFFFYFIFCFYYYFFFFWMRMSEINSIIIHKIIHYAEYASN